MAMGAGAAMLPLGLQRTTTLAQSGGSLFPDNRVLLYYGFPGNENMGILGEYPKEEVFELLKEEAANYEAADPDRPVKIGFEVIASVAQGSPGPEEMYVADTPGKVLTEYCDFAAENDMVVFLDVQMGFKEPHEDYEGLERWIKLPHVHLGIDPEFHMKEGELPGQDIGQVTAEEVTRAQEWLVEIAAKYETPPKSLIVHQFHHSMIEDKDQVKPMDGVDLIIDMDGWGSPELKEETYTVVITEEPIEYNGIKLFYQLDDPIMSAEEVLAFDPAPDLVIYQ
jgi:hypothetical protein